MKLLLLSLTVLFCIALAGFGAKPNPSLDNPAVVAAAAPVYPAIAFNAKAEGEVIVEVKINSTGDVVATKLVQGHTLLRAPSVIAARRWKFQPAEGSDNRVVNLTFSFRGFYKGKKPEADDTPVFYPPYKVEVSMSLPMINF